MPPLRTGISLVLAGFLLSCAVSGRAESMDGDGLSGLLPDHVRVQFAGQSGWLSGGAGYGFWNGRFETTLLYGMVPGWMGGLTIHTLAQHAGYSPLLLHPAPGLAVYPITLGLAAHVGLGRQYDLLLEERFRGYYWPSALHFRIFAGAKVRKELSSRRYLKGVTAVAEIGTLEAYLRPYLENESLSLGEILSLSLALQWHR